jgi:hypothetical protein
LAKLGSERVTCTCAYCAYHQAFRRVSRYSWWALGIEPFPFGSKRACFPCRGGTSCRFDRFLRRRPHGASGFPD